MRPPQAALLTDAGLHAQRDADARLREIKRRAPRAKVFVVGYPTVLPATGTGCYPRVPVLPADVPYLRSKVQELNGMLKARATASIEIP